jgi:putative transposase
MPRGPRRDAPGVLHPVMVRGIERRSLFREETDREDFVARLAALADGGAIVVYAWALFPNHAHLLVRTGRRPLARSMRSLLTPLCVGGETRGGGGPRLAEGNRGMVWLTHRTSG